MNTKPHVKIKEGSISPIYVSNKNCDLPEWIPPLNTEFRTIESHSWFDIRYYENPKRLPVQILDTCAPIVDSQSYQQQMRTIRRRKLNKEPVFIHTEKVRIYPTNEQKIILCEWFTANTKMYNAAIQQIRACLFADNELFPIEDIDDIIRKYDFRASLQETRNQIIRSMKHPIYTHIMDETIALAVANYKSCITNLKNGHIKKFRVRFLPHDRRRYIFKIEKNFFNNGTFCQNTFPFMKSSKPLTDIEHTVTLQYDKDARKYILLVPTHIDKEECCTNDLDCGIDLGVRCFATTYSKNEVFCIGNNPYKKIKKYHDKIDTINRLRAVPLKDRRDTPIIKTRVIEEIEVDDNGEEHKTKRKERYQAYKNIRVGSLKRALRKYHRKIKNMVRDLHYKTAYHLVTRYDSIFVGKLSTKKILSKNNWRINKETKRMVGVLSPSLFRQRLKYMGDKFGRDVFDTNEYLTTQTCSRCGRINKVGANKIYHCVYCGLITDRDMNSSKTMEKVGYVEQTEFNTNVELLIIDGFELTRVKGTKEYEIREV